VIFQPELRRGLAALGGHPIFSLTSEKRETVHDLAEACDAAGQINSFGALIAIERDTSIRVYEETGVTIDGEFSVELVLAFFIQKARFTMVGSSFATAGSQAAACIFPVSQRETLDRSLAAPSCRPRITEGIRCRGGDSFGRDRQHFHLHRDGSSQLISPSETNVRQASRKFYCMANGNAAGLFRNYHRHGHRILSDSEAGRDGASQGFDPAFLAD